jgi:hypothetical protein
MEISSFRGRFPPQEPAFNITNSRGNLQQNGAESGFPRNMSLRLLFRAKTGSYVSLRAIFRNVVSIYCKGRRAVV